MIINIVYVIILLILIYVIYIAIKAINTGMEAKNSNKLQSENTKEDELQDSMRQNITDELIKLDGLLKTEIITKEEFEKAKKKLLDN